ncbi:MAG: transglutaminase-like domain-containing protein, partial [Bacteroidales bacterium]|nr:transglutaminase-like domain-containing protein [Bacteroidales bacterium]
MSSCNNDRLVKEENYIMYIEEGFEVSKDIANKRASELFASIDESLSENELLALKFYFAAMPLSDLADYNGDFFLENIRLSLRARNDYPWLKKLPDDIFLHFVLPIRVNNENLDSFRLKYYDELKQRLVNINDIEKAALEINHWCHEKVSYQSADIRTSGPESTLLSARGRCGEESTFTVAALRTAGIPARQVYVPRWAHSDDNHAWVEVWINGIWKYMGACEPEAVLNRGWFTESASRAMLVHTRTFGKYFGNEKLINSTGSYGEINNLELYTDVKEIRLKVIDSEGGPVNNASVQFCQ